MQGLLATLLFLYLWHPLKAACPPADVVNLTDSSGTLSWDQLRASSQTCVNLSKADIAGIRGIPSSKSPLKDLDLSHNRLRSLPAGFLNHTEGLERLFLEGNVLPELPPAFFEKSSQLKELRLEGNPLPSVPTSLFHLCLETLTVDCRCDVVRSISSYCQRPNCSGDILCHCSSPQGFLNVTDFYAQQCPGLSVAMAVAMALSILALLLGAAVAFVLIRRKKKGATMVQEKRESSASNGAHPRYISRTGPQVDQARGLGSHADYENVFIGQTPQARGGHRERPTRKQPKSR